MHQHNFVKETYHCVACSNCSPPVYKCKYNPNTGKTGCYTSLSIEEWEKRQRTVIQVAQIGIGTRCL